MDNVKNQHYVPRFYLKEWCVPNTEKVYVYDKLKNEIRYNHIEKVASEKHFYDFNLNELFNEETVKAMNENGVAIGGRLKIIEKMLSSNLESPCAVTFAKIINKARESTPWIRKECYFLSLEEKTLLSVYLAYQFIRTKRIRQDILRSAENIVEFARNLGATEEAVEKIRLRNEAANRIHNRMLLDKDHILQISYLIHRLVWVLAINRTNLSLFTSDNPIGLRGHNKKKPAFLGTGLASSGVELCYPLAPDLILVMVDGEYHTQFASDDRHYTEFVKNENIEYYNSITSMQSERIIISCNDDFSLLQKIDI